MFVFFYIKKFFLVGFYFNNLIIIDSFTFFGFNFLTFLFFLFLIFGYHKFYKNRLFSFSFINFFVFVGCFFFLSVLQFSNNFIFTFLLFEGASFCLYYLAGLNKKNVYSMEASLKYFILGSFSSSFMLFGIALLYSNTLSLFFNDINFFFFNFLNSYTFSYSVFSDVTFFFEFSSIFLSIFFIFIGFFFKLGLVPYHNWLIDVYDGSSLLVVYFFSTVSKFGFFFHFLKIAVYCFFSFFFFLSIFFKFLGLISIVLGSLALYKQYRIKRFFAYSSINNIGIVFLILGLDSFESFIYAFFYFLNYVIVLNLLFFLFLSLFFVNQEYLFNSKNNTNSVVVLLQDDVQYITDLSKISFSLSKKKSVIFFFILFSFVIFSFIGIPPLIGFFMKYFLFLGLLLHNEIISLIIFFFSTLISSYNYLRLLKIFLYEKVSSDQRYFVILDSLTNFFLFLFLSVIIFYFLFSYCWFYNIYFFLNIIFKICLFPHLYSTLSLKFFLF